MLIFDSSVDRTPVACLFYPVHMISFSDLISQSTQFDIMKDCNAPVQGSLIFSPDGRAEYGGFKRATFGHTSPPIFSDDSGHVCIKQCWYLCRTSQKKLLYDKASQASKLSSEINCLQWANALMELVYGFIADDTTQFGKPPFDIPQMHYIKSALAVSESKTHSVYMIEEVIELANGGFVKYIGNSLAVPNVFNNTDLDDRVLFLAFTQHLQY